jgi:hypothetical protein
MISGIQIIASLIPDQVARSKVPGEISHFHNLTNHHIVSLEPFQGYLVVVEMWSPHGSSRRNASRTRFRSVALSPQ